MRKEKEREMALQCLLPSWFAKREKRSSFWFLHSFRKLEESGCSDGASHQIAAKGDVRVKGAAEHIMLNIV